MALEDVCRGAPAHCALWRVTEGGCDMNLRSRREGLEVEVSRAGM
jgi:hypothetical protein